MSTFYGQAALDGFTAALTATLGIKVAFIAGKPSTNGTDIALPPINNPIELAEFEAVCGTAIHEAAHVYFSTVPEMVKYAGGNRLRAACFNAVVDVADETRIEAVINAKKLLRRMNRHAERDILAADQLNKSDPVWAVLAVGILFNRNGRGNVYAKVRKIHPHYSLMVKAYKILQRCKHRDGSASGPARTRDQWNRLCKAADELVELLKHLGDASGAPVAFGAFGIDPNKLGEPDAAFAPGDTIATATDGENTLTGGSAAEAADAAIVVIDLPGTDAADPMDGPMVMNKWLYSTIKPSIRGAVERMAACDDAGGLSEGYYSGVAIGRNIERAMIGGDCFARRNAEGERLHVVIALDISGSMNGRIAEVSAVAQAFADCVGPVAESMALAVYNGDVYPTKHFRNAMPNGGTCTGRACEWAERVLAGKPGRRVCVVLTDGATSYVDECISACGRSAGAAGSVQTGNRYLH